MCGIAGLYCRNGVPADAAALSRTMIEQVRHRGPDGFGFHVAANVALAHARLSIIDLATGQQPIRNRDGSVWTVFNGEIFNYLELRKELEAAGYCFYTQSDTEVLVHLYDRDGDEFVQHLNGQFAIALWDERRQRLVLARDRTGIRPLFYARVGRAVAFASEIKSLLALPGMSRSLDMTAIGEIFTFWSSLPPRTAFENVNELPAGCLLVLDATGETLRRYWDWTFPETIPSQVLQTERLAAELLELLVDAVKLQLRADVPVGAYLSGGLDSSAIAAIARHHTQTPLHTFSLGFEDAQFDESDHQSEMVRHLESRHTRVVCRRSDIARVFPKVIRHAETPILRTAPAPLMLLSEQVRSAGFKVVLTGEGADEVFGGYDLFKEAKIRRFWARAPQSRWRPSLLPRLYGHLENSPVAAGGMSRRFFGAGLDEHAQPTFAHAMRWQSTQRLWRFFSAATRERLADVSPTQTLLAALPAGIERWPPLGRDQYVEAHTLLSGYLLSSQGDRVAMANSIEGRMPYLDHRLIEFGSRLHPSRKIRGLNEKFLLKRALRGVLPASILDRVKQPYRAPDAQSFLGDDAPGYVAELLSPSHLRSRGYFDPIAVKALIDKCRAGRSLGMVDDMAFVGILSTLLLDELFVSRRAVD